MLLTAGLAWIVVIAAPDVAYPVMLAPVIISGAGFAMALPADIKAVIGSVPPADIGKASATFSTMRQLGRAFGVAILAAVFADEGSYASAASFSNGFAAATAAAAGLAMAGAICRCAHRSPSISILLRVSLPRTFWKARNRHKSARSYGWGGNSGKPAVKMFRIARAALPSMYDSKCSVFPSFSPSALMTV